MQYKNFDVTVKPDGSVLIRKDDGGIAFSTGQGGVIQRILSVMYSFKDFDVLPTDQVSQTPFKIVFTETGGVLHTKDNTMDVPWDSIPEYIEVVSAAEARALDSVKAAKRSKDSIFFI